MHHSENPLSLQGPGSSPFAAAGLGSKKEKKKQAKEDRDRQKQVEKKRRRLEKALATSAAIRLELEKKKQRKREEEQRLDEEGAALAEAVALHVLLDEDTEGVTHLETYAEIDFASLSILSRSDQTRVGTDNCVSYLSSHGPLDCMLSSGIKYHSSFAYAFINGGGNKESLHSLASHSEFMNSLNQSRQVAVRLDYENPKAWIENNREQRHRVCSDKVTNAGVAFDLPFEPVTMHTVGDRKMYNIDAGKNVLDAIVLKALD
ncbi:hypothetical protein GOP47_0012062 [Adiantum capillus-veneris]|uniref:Uncharacterized protein n=1 Tax=Adiantum capillus-veneris TaxID=13818 RepID=A0A9D4ZG01_ADICA|nr:hypothetical protein GOP47_0012062 [Adiantum capillus-veneris]